MDTWVENCQTENSQVGKVSIPCAHMKQIVLLSTILEFTRLVIDDFMEENGLVPPLPKRSWVPQIQKVPKKFEIFAAP